MRFPMTPNAGDPASSGIAKGMTSEFSNGQRELRLPFCVTLPVELIT